MTWLKSIVLGVLLGATIGMPATGSAHNPANFYVLGDWSNPRLPTIYFRPTDDVPEGGARGRLQDAQDPWISVDGGATYFNFVYLGTDASGVDFPSCPGGSSEFEGYVDREPLGVPTPESITLARTTYCHNDAGKVRMFGIAYNGDVDDWYFGSGDTPMSDHDYWAVITHELGHATGWYVHFIALDGTPPGYPETFCDETVSNYHTMCKIYWTSSGPFPNRGEWPRTLAPHDIDTFESKYSS